MDFTASTELSQVIDSKRKDSEKSLRCALITVSDSRTLQTDESGAEAVHLLEEQRMRVERTVVPDDPSKISLVLRHWLKSENVDWILINGGTDLIPRRVKARDGSTATRNSNTVDLVRQNLDREIPGFGELFRRLEFDEIGAGAMLSNAVGGFARSKVVFALPGSPRAIKMALETLILPQIENLVRELEALG